MPEALTFAEPSAPSPSLSVNLLPFARIAGVCAARILMFVVQMAFVRLYTRAISTSELGYYYFLASAAAVLNSALFIPLDEFQQAKSIALVDNGFGLQSIIRLNANVLATCAVFTALTEAVLHIAHFHPGSALLLMSLSLLTYGGTALRRLLNNLRYWKTAQALFLLEPLVKCAAFGLYITHVRSSASDLTLVTMAGFAVVVALSWLALTHFGLFKLPASRAIRIGPVITKIWPMSYGFLLTLLQTYGYRLILVPLGYSEMVGLYGTVTQLGQAGMVSVANVFRQVYDPRLYSTNGAFLRGYMKLAGLVSLCCLLGAVIVAGPVIRLCTKPEFAAYAAIVAYGVCAEVASLISGALFTYLTIVGKTASLRLASTCGFVLYVLSFGCLAWTHAISLYTVGIPMVISHAVAIGVLLMVSLRNTEVRS